MDGAPRYTLSEEIVRQAVEVLFREDSNWQVSFSNPTAGPWKMIQLGQYIGPDMRYLKEEDRPDLILFNPRAALFLVLEAKDDIRKLIAARRVGSSSRYEQLEKSVEVFAKEARRIDGILSLPANLPLVFGSAIPQRHTIVCGYVYGATGAGLGINQKVLHQLHVALATTKNDARLLPCIDFVVSQQASMDLVTGVWLSGASSTLAQFLRPLLPQQLWSSSQTTWPFGTA